MKNSSLLNLGGWSLLILMSVVASAQLYTCTVTGVVSDPSGAVIPNAKVELVDQAKGYSFTAKTDVTGRFLFNSATPGTYKISVEAQGFQTATQSDIKLDVNQNVTVNFSLQVGTAAQAVEITGAAPVLATQDAVTGQLVDRKFINDLPLLGRSVTNLAFLTPGVMEIDNTCPAGFTGAGSSGGFCTANNFVSNGSRNSTVDFLIDGVTTSNFEQHANILMPTYTPSVDAVEEFSVQGSSFSAEYGFTGSTIINMVTRSGTNQFHGSGYDFLRNQVLNANSFFNNAAGIPIPPLKQNNFGATIGGPIKRDKTFFFFDYDGTRAASLESFVAGVPSAAERTGNFGELCTRAGGSFDAAGKCSSPDGQLWDPYTGVYDPSQGGPVRSGYIPFNNMITYMSPGNPKLNGTGYQLPAQPGNLLDPIALKYIQYMPLPNYGVGTAAYDPYANWRSSTAARSRNDQYDIKIDHRFSDHDLTSVKYSKDQNSQPPVNCYGNAADGCSVGTYIATAHLAAINHTHTFSPTLLLTASYGLTRGTYLQTIISGQAPYKGINPVTTLGMPAYMNRSGLDELPVIYFSNYAQAASSIPSLGGVSLGTQPWCCAREGSDVHHLLGALTWVRGKHDLKFGAEGRMHRMSYTLPATPAGLFSYDFTSTSEFPFSGGGDSIASFLTGVGGPGAWGQYEIPNYVTTQSFQAGGFVQDNWKVSKKLTLNVGVRYDLNTPRSERYNRMNELSPTVVSPVQAPGLATLHGGEVFMTPSERNNYNIDSNNIAPRFGFAYQPISKTVIRGGYGIFFGIGNSGSAGTGAPGYQGYDETTPWLTSYQNDHATPWGRLSDPFPIVGPKLPPGSSLGLMNDVGFSAVGPIPSRDSTIPYEQVWSFGIQKELPSSFLLDLNYLGKKGTHLQFGPAANLDVLGPQIEKYGPDQIAALNTYVPNPFFGVIKDPNSSLSQPTVPAWQLQLPFPQFTSFSGDQPLVANSIYHALQAKVEKRFSHGLQLLVTYTWSKSIDDASTTQGWLGGQSSLQDPNNYRLERSLSSFDIPHFLQFSYTYELPIGRGKPLGGTMNPVLNAVIGGWQTNGIWRISSGRPLALGLNGGQSLPTYGGQRPDLTGTLHCSSSNILNDYFANPEVVVTPAPFALGTAPRMEGSCRQPGIFNANWSLFKEFSLAKLREGARIEFRLEAYNAFNHVVFAAPNATLNSGSFGVITAQANSPRQVQGALKVYW